MIASLRKDLRLLKKCIVGDKKASEKFIRAFSDLVYRNIYYALVAKNVHFHQADLEDLHNTVFLHLFEKQCKKLGQFEGKNGCSLANWMRVVTVRIVLNQLRKKGLDSIRWQPRRVAFEDIPELSAAVPGPLAKIERAEKQRFLKKEIRNLPPRARLLLQLHFESGYSLKEVAEIMKLSMNNAHTIKHRALQKLKSRLETAE
jgi:RNA polymerase sigma factor (sigma-70 family)